MWTERLAQAATTVAGHPLRSALAALAVAAAVATTVVVQTALDELSRSARETSARAFGADVFLLTRVASGNLNRRELAQRLARNPNITRADVRFLERTSDGLVRYAATTQRQADLVAGSRRFENAIVNGTQASLQGIRDIQIAAGRFLIEHEEMAGSTVVVLGHGVAEELFPAGNAIGGSVRVAGRAFTVVGVQVRQGTAGGVSLDRYVWMPLRAFERALGSPGSLQIFAAAPAPRPIVAAEDRARISMRARRRLGPGTDDTFDLVTPEASRGFVTAITERISAAALPIALMALIAAMVVVTNTSLVSVTQRTHEIGIRRAVGAPRAVIVQETLAETSIIGLVGGLLGLGIGAGALAAASRLMQASLTLGPITAVVSLAAAVGAGALAGWYPARRAAALDVIAALRSE